jgi:hypothetical protein
MKRSLLGDLYLLALLSATAVWGLKLLLYAVWGLKLLVYAVWGLKLLARAAVSAQVWPRRFADGCWRMPTYADVCRRMLTYAAVCWRMLPYAGVSGEAWGRAVEADASEPRLAVRGHPQATQVCQYLYFCTSKALVKQMHQNWDSQFVGTRKLLRCVSSLRPHTTVA